MGKSRKRKKATYKVPPKAGRGFEFGHLPRAMFASTSSFEFNNQMIAAEVNGCAYGFDEVEGYPFPIPTLTIVGQHLEPLVEASKCLEHWGCRQDGDSVDITIVLRNDGSYLLGVQPNHPRMINRFRKDSALVETLFAGATWIKKIDSTNPILRGWIDYRKSRLSPIKVMLATADSRNGIPVVDTLRLVPGAVQLVKFDLQITTEEAEPKHWFFDIVDRKRAKPGKGPTKPTAASIVAARRNVIDGVFPVSRERIRRANLLGRVQELTAAGGISPSQIEQAAINVALSHEWAEGKDHYEGLEDIDKKWWEFAGRRVEICGTRDEFAPMEPAAVLEQLQRDVEHTLRRHGVVVAAKFADNQRQFVRLGYAKN